VWARHPDAGVKFAAKALADDGGKKPGRRGEHVISRKAIARGVPGDSGVTCMLVCASTTTHAHGTAGASGARHSLRPLLERARNYWQTSGAGRGENADSRHCERSEAIQLSCFARQDGLLRRFAPRNDGLPPLSSAKANDPRGRGVLDTPHARGMTAEDGASRDTSFQKTMGCLLLRPLRQITLSIK